MKTNFSNTTKTIIIITAIAILYALAWSVQQSGNGFSITRIDKAGTIKTSMDDHFPGEYEIINKAAIRNGIKIGSEDEAILYAIRFAEKGRKGLEFGILVPGVNTLDLQAGWAAASVVKSRARWVKAGKPEDFITFMGARYCPPEAHPLNKNWVGNVKHWTKVYARMEWAK